MIKTTVFILLQFYLEFSDNMDIKYLAVSAQAHDIIITKKKYYNECKKIKKNKIKKGDFEEYSIFDTMIIYTPCVLHF